MDENSAVLIAQAIRELAEAVRLLAASYSEGEIEEDAVQTFESLDDA